MDYAIFLSMRKHLSLKIYFYLGFAATALISGIILLCIGHIPESMFAFLPIPFCSWVYFSFFYPKDVQAHAGGLFLSIFSRFLCMVASLLLPALIWKFVPAYKDISYFWLFFPFAEVMLVYGLTILNNILEKKKE